MPVPIEVRIGWIVASKRVIPVPAWAVPQIVVSLVPGKPVIRTGYGVTAQADQTRCPVVSVNVGMPEFPYPRVIGFFDESRKLSGGYAVDEWIGIGIGLADGGALRMACPAQLAGPSPAMVFVTRSGLPVTRGMAAKVNVTVWVGPLA